MSDGILQETIEQLMLLAPASRGDMLKSIEHILAGSLGQILDSHNTNSAIFVFSTPVGQYLLKAEYGNDNVTSKEVVWYKTVPGDPAIPPLVASFSKNSYAFLILKYIEKVQTLEELITAKAITAKRLADYVDKALAKDRQLFATSNPASTSFNEANQFYLEKYKKRVADSQRYGYLRSLLEATELRINGQVLHPPAYYLHKIYRNPSLRHYLVPNELGLIHGDLHCGNILVGQDQDKIYLVDPNGTVRMPLEYDYGKMLHSIHGGYNELMNKRYDLQVSDNEYTFDFIMPEIYDVALERVRKQLDDQEFLRGLFAEAMHFATLLPHHAAKQDETTVLFLRCIYIFEELFYNLNIKWT